MKFSLRTLLYLIIVIAGILYVLTAPPNIYIQDPKISLRPNDERDIFSCKLVNRGVFPVYIQSYKDYSDEITVLRPKRIGEAPYSKDEWCLDIEFGFGPTLKPPEWKGLYFGDTIKMSNRFKSNDSDRRIKINLVMTDWLGRLYQFQCEEMKHDASGSIEEIERLQNKPMDTKRRASRFDF